MTQASAVTAKDIIVGVVTSPVAAAQGANDVIQGTTSALNELAEVSRETAQVNLKVAQAQMDAGKIVVPRPYSAANEITGTFSAVGEGISQAVDESFVGYWYHKMAGK